MAYDRDDFVLRYLGHAELPLPIGAGWAIARVGVDRARRALDIVLASSTGGSITAFVEPRTMVATACATTAALALSYYPEPTVAAGEAALALEALAARLRSAEARLGPNERGLGAWGSSRRREPSAAKREHASHGALELGSYRECNQGCVFCSTPPSSAAIAAGAEVVRARMAAGRAAGFRRLTLTGGEPTLDPLLDEHLRLARAQGYERIGVQSNGTGWAERSRLAEHVAAGMTSAEISLHTAEPDTFAELIGPPALLERTLRAIAGFAAFPQVELCIVVVLTRRNLDELPGLVTQLGREAGHVRAVSLSPMAPVGRALERLDLLPRLGALAAPLAAAFAAAERHGLRVALPARCGAPPCAMPAGGERHNALLASPEPLGIEPGKSKPASCARCRHDTLCSGVWNVYRRMYGDSELVPRP